MEDKNNKLKELYDNIEKDSKMLRDAAEQLKGQIKILNDHYLCGSVLSSYITTLSKLNEQLIVIEKMKQKEENKDKVAKKADFEDIKREMNEEIGTAIKSN